MQTRSKLRPLIYFVAVAEELHFGRAARRLGMAQPPLSQQIQKLEAAVGHPLFQRRPTVELTPAGRALLPLARQAGRQVEEAMEAARRAGEGLAGRLSVGFAASALLSDLPRIIRGLRRSFPEIDLQLRELSTAQQLDALYSGDIELGFMREPLPHADLVVEEVLREPFVAVLPLRHALASRKAVPLSALAREPFIHFPRDVSPGLFDQVQGLFSQAGASPRIIQEAREWLTIVGLVESGLGVSLVPESFRKLRWGRIIYRPIRPSQARTTVALCRKRGPQSPAAGRFLEVARGVLGE